MLADTAVVISMSDAITPELIQYVNQCERLKENKTGLFNRVKTIMNAHFNRALTDLKEQASEELIKKHFKQIEDFFNKHQEFINIQNKKFFQNQLDAYNKQYRPFQFSKPTLEAFKKIEKTYKNSFRI